MLPSIVPDAYRSLLNRAKIGAGAGQVSAGDHAHAGMVTSAYDDLVAESKIGTGPAQVLAGDKAYDSLAYDSRLGPGASQVAEGDHGHASPVIWANKPVQTSITSDSSLNLDPHLQGITLPVGKYHMRSILGVQTTAARGIKTYWDFSGAIGLQGVSYRVHNEALALIYALLGDFSGPVRNVTYPVSLTTFRPIIWDGILDVTTEGDLTLQWAQLVSGAGNTIVSANSFVALMPLP